MLLNVRNCVARTFHVERIEMCLFALQYRAISHLIV